MNTKIIKRIAIASIVLALLTIVVFIVNFRKHCISTEISDWGNFGSYINGVISPILVGLNIYIFFILTKTASEFGKKNMKIQLSFSTCQEYQDKINDLTFEFLQNIELYKENKDEKYIDRAKNRLNWIKFFVDSFTKEARPLISSDLLEIKEEFENAIDNLMNSNFSKEEPMQLFFDKKSEFIQSVYYLMINK